MGTDLDNLFGSGGSNRNKDKDENKEDKSTIDINKLDKLGEDEVEDDDIEEIIDEDDTDDVVVVQDNVTIVPPDMNSFNKDFNDEEEYEIEINDGYSDNDGVEINYNDNESININTNQVQFKNKKNIKNTNDHLNEKNINIIDLNPKKKLPILLILVVLLVLVGVYYLINFALSYFSDKSMEDYRDRTYVKITNEYINYVRMKVAEDKIPNCDGTVNEKLYLFEEIAKENNTCTKESPYGGNINLNDSYVKVTAERIEGMCKVSYYVYITDNKYKIGSKNDPILDISVNVDSIKK